MKNNVNSSNFLHIQQVPKWEVGKVYTTVNGFNHFTNHIYINGTNCKFVNSNNGDCIDVNPLRLAKEVLKISKGGKKDIYLQDFFDYDPLLTLEILQKALNEHMKFTREVIFEKVRLEFFPDKPSRQNCIWLIEDDNKTVNYWLSTFQQKGLKIFEVEVTGEIHIADQQYLDLSADPLNKLIDRAKKYWNSEQPTNPTFNECVFNGSLKVVSERNINDLK